MLILDATDQSQLEIEAGFESKVPRSAFCIFRGRRHPPTDLLRRQRGKWFHDQFIPHPFVKFIQSNRKWILFRRILSRDVGQDVVDGIGLKDGFVLTTSNIVSLVV